MKQYQEYLNILKTVFKDAQELKIQGESILCFSNK